MKRFIFILLLLFVLLVDSIADSGRLLVVKSKDGTQTTFALADKPTVSFGNGELIVEHKSLKFSIELVNVHNFTFTETSMAINEITKNGKFLIENGYLIFNGLPRGSTVSVITLDGRIVGVYNSDNNGNTIVNLADLHKGIFILRSDKLSVKITNR